ncbi:hypothetical protein Thimo_1627 [Thioflavicoccus mobilis 8321]|uniref:CHAD domain-containing protein n=1 Tax=Thioflavicoccus mobilis 8321 TaxID=765912 RepID=L0GYE5_9GAMM|nr:CHAD domain-containing protein [Thioflavicoccus mobilis]AGA90405.1 hypothetical protein Thimo_1627 [Thioflavicoccus mobilis 8321]
MSQTIREFLVPHGADLTGVLATLHQRQPLEEGPWLTCEQRFFDSFDWRLFNASASFALCLDTEGSRLLWEDLAGEEPPLVQDWAGTPGLVADLPEGPVRERLAPILGVRRLLPVITIVSREQTLYLTGDGGQPCARLLVIVSEFREPTRGRTGPMAARLRLATRPEHTAEADALAADLHEGLELQRARMSIYTEALAAAGRRPGDYSSKLDFALTPDARADASVKTILGDLLKTIEANVEGAKAHLDPEFLHDLRVATRRTRSGLGQIKGIFPPELVTHYKARFAWLQQATGPARDLDVYRQGFGGYLAALPPALRPHLAPLEAYLVAQHRGAQCQVTEVLGSAEFRELIDAWRTFLAAPVPTHDAPASAERPVKAVADANLWRLYRQVRDEGRAIGPDAPPPELHELRKSCKKLRYLMEFFRRLYPTDEIAPLIKLTKVLLDNLGLFQDFAVQGQFLHEAALRMTADGSADTDTLLAMGALIASLLQRQEAAREAFDETFARFDTAGHRAAFRRLFKPAS